MCTPCSSTLIPLCTYCRLGGTSLTSVGLWKPCLRFITNASVKECNLAFNAFKYNFQQRISWLSHRWRTQRNAISNVNCRIQWIIESLNAPCAPWYSEEHACLSVMEFSTLFAFVNRAWTWRFIAGTCDRLLLNVLALNPCGSAIGVIIVYAVVEKQYCWDQLPIVLHWTKSTLTFDLKSGRITRWT